MSRDQLFWSKVDQGEESNCWEWKAGKNKDGYGMFWVGNTFVHAHRYAWEYNSGQKIPKGYIICHHCDNRACCNHTHLFIGTVQDNIDDKIKKGRLGYSGRPGLTPDQVLLIKLAYRSRILSQQDIADAFGVRQSVICRLLKNKGYGGTRWLEVGSCWHIPTTKNV